MLVAQLLRHRSLRRRQLILAVDELAAEHATIAGVIEPERELREQLATRLLHLMVVGDCLVFRRRQVGALREGAAKHGVELQLVWCDPVRVDRRLDDHIGLRRVQTQPIQKRRLVIVDPIVGVDHCNFIGPRLRLLPIQIRWRLGSDTHLFGELCLASRRQREVCGRDPCQAPIERYLEVRLRYVERHLLSRPIQRIQRGVAAAQRRAHVLTVTKAVEQVDGRGQLISNSIELRVRRRQRRARQQRQAPLAEASDRRREIRQKSSVRFEQTDARQTHGISAKLDRRSILQRDLDAAAEIQLQRIVRRLTRQRTRIDNGRDKAATVHTSDMPVARSWCSRWPGTLRWNVGWSRCVRRKCNRRVRRDLHAIAVGDGTAKVERHAIAIHDSAGEAHPPPVVVRDDHRLQMDP